MDTTQISKMLAEVAAEIIVPRFGALDHIQDIEQKTGPSDLVTIADQQSEAEITKRLTGAFPGALIVGEESAFAEPSLLDALPDAEQAFVIDPIDGTLNFVKGSDNFAVMVAEVIKGKTTRGWIYQPMYQAFWVTERGAGVTLNDVQVSAPILKERPLLGATYIPLKREADMPAQLQRSWGSCGIDYPKLIQGEVDFLAYRSMFPWDHLPGGLMVTELGGVIATDDETAYRPGVIGRRVLSAMSMKTFRRANKVLASWGKP